MSQAIIKNGVTVRQLVLGSVEAIPEEWYDKQPHGFNHTIRWNIGHMLTMMNWFLANQAAFEYKLPEQYLSLFISGTKPDDWSDTPPTKEELLCHLSGQCEALAKIPVELLEQQLEHPFEMGPLSFMSIAELLNFAVAHEAVHLGMISGLVKVIKVS
ncbi:DinB family protein [Paenibacillus sp. UNC451MF]|uniref:DinB family protein n=1 Tax=Paenibacillus sp. UNC451MF TaxID=1449063 RepID=UPI00048D931C|nr:DinB family protein [Paenibacillus sp. UNC451MF]